MIYEFEGFQLDTNLNGNLRFEELKLGTTQKRLLLEFLKAPLDEITVADLYGAVWKETYRINHKEQVERQIRTVRQKLREATGKECIKKLPGGFKCTMTVIARPDEQDGFHDVSPLQQVIV